MIDEPDKKHLPKIPPPRPTGPDDPKPEHDGNDARGGLGRSALDRIRRRWGV